VFTPELMRSKQGPGNPSTVPVFILGMPRSGTTLVEQILASHPKIFGAGERDDFEKAMIRLSDRKRVSFPELVRTISDEDLRQLGTSYLDVIRAIAPEASRITDKMPLNFHYIWRCRMRASFTPAATPSIPVCPVSRRCSQLTNRTATILLNWGAIIAPTRP
jgi:hypothetical protein